MSEPPPSRLFRLTRQLVMLMCCAFVVGAHSYGQVDNVIGQIANLKDPDPDIRENAAQVLRKFKDPRGVEPLIGALKDPAASVRAAAANALGELHDLRATAPVTQLLQDKDYVVQMSACMALSKLRDARAVQPLIAHLRRKDLQDVVRNTTIIALSDIGAPAVNALLTLLNDKDASLRADAAYALRRVEDPRKIDPLIATLQDPDATVREAAVSSLAWTKDPRTIDPLIASMNDANPKVRSIAARSLRNSPRAIDPLSAALQDPDSDVRRSATEALGYIKDERAVPPLLKALKDKDDSVRRFAIEALGRHNDPSVVPSLIGALKDPNEGVRGIACMVLGGLRDPRAVEPLIAVLNDPKDRINHNIAARALGNIGDPRATEALMAAIKKPEADECYSAALASMGEPAIESLIATLQKKDFDARRRAIGALGRSKDSRAIDALIAVLHDPDSRIREDAVMSLGDKPDVRLVQPLIMVLRKDPVDWIREFAGQALLRIGVPAIDGLIPVLDDSDVRTRQLAAETLGQIALVKGNDPRAIEALLRKLRERNLAVIAGAHVFFVDRGEPGSEDAVIEALNRFGSERMAGYLLNCGNVKVEAATRAWLKLHYPRMKQSVYGVLWGGRGDSKQPASHE